jgi:hypothetical protein
MLEHWLDEDAVEAELTRAYSDQFPDPGDQQKWKDAYQRWRKLDKLEEFFPKSGDVYVDGGAIDNTPSNTIIDATREWLDRTGKSNREVEIDSYIVFLEPKPVISKDDVEDPAFHQVVARTLKIQEVAKQTSDAVVVDTINYFGKKAEALGETLTVVLENFQEQLSKLPQTERDQVLSDLYKSAQDAKLRGYLKDTPDGLVERIVDWAEDILDNRLPLQVNEVVIYPETMPMGTLQFTERLGYRHDNAVKMLTTGCAHTLWTVWESLGRKSQSKLDEKDKIYLRLAQKWTGLKENPKNIKELKELQGTWKCQRKACAFYHGHCTHGAKKS